MILYVQRLFLFPGSGQVYDSDYGITGVTKDLRSDRLSSLPRQVTTFFTPKYRYLMVKHITLGDDVIDRMLASKVPGLRLNHVCDTTFHCRHSNTHIFDHSIVYEPQT